MTPTSSIVRLRVVYVILAVSSASFGMLQSLVTPVLREIATQLDTDQTTVIWVFTAYLLSASVCTPIIGRIGDKVGKERLLVVALGGLAVGSLLAAVAPSIGVMILARVVQGIGGGVMPLAFGIIRDVYPSRKVAGVVGIVSALGAFGAGVGVVIAGPIVSTLGYRWLFWLPMIITTVAAVGAKLVVPPSSVRHPGRISLLPAALLSSWLVCLLLGVSRGNVWGWDSGRVLGLIGASVLLAAVWIGVERRSASPLIDLQMMRLPAVWTTNVVSLMAGFGMYACYGFLPQFIQTDPSAGYGFGASITESGLILLPSTLMTFVGGMVSGRLVRRVGAKSVVVIGCLLGAASTVLLVVAHDEKWQMYVANFVQGAGFGLIFACLSNLIVEAVPPRQTGVASGMNANIRTIGGSIGSAVMAAVVAATVLPGHLATDAGYTRGFAMVGGGFVLAAAVALLIPTPSRSAAEQPMASVR